VPSTEEFSDAERIQFHILFVLFLLEQKDIRKIYLENFNRNQEVIRDTIFENYGKMDLGDI